jgi:L-malate glycosyltransferase
MEGSRTIRILVISNYRSTVTVRPEAEIFIGLKRKYNFDITVMTYGDAPYVLKFREAGINVIDFHPKKKFSFEEAAVIRKELEQKRYDVLQLFNNKALTNGILAARGLPLKVVGYRGYTGNINWWDPFMYIKYLNPRVDRIICLVEPIRQLFLRNMFFGKHRPVTINKGHDVAWYEDIQPANLQESGIPSDAFTLVCVANARPMKGIKYLMKAMDELVDYPKIHLLLIGNGMEKFKGKSKSKTIHWLGFRKDAINIVRSCHAFVLSSIKGEAITKAVIEAMCLKVTPVITDIDGNRDLVVHEVSGLVVPSKNPEAIAAAVKKLYENPALLKVYGENAFKHIQTRLNINTTIDEFAALYSSLTTESR